ncbi:MAG: TetR/AcrR family transcriptional regulator [Nitrospinota bacterium]
MKDKILKLAQQQMKAGGYENLSFAKIADDLSTTRANVHHHFRNKEGLALQATQKYIDETSQNMLSLFEKNKGNFVGFLCDMEGFFLNQVKESGRQGSCVCGQLVREPNTPDSILKLAQSHFDTFKIFLETMIKESQENGLINKTIAPPVLSTLTMSIILGLNQLAMVHGDNPEFLTEIKGTLTKFVSAYKK